MRVSVVCVIDDGEEMLCDDNSKLKRNVLFSCLCNRWWRNVCVMIILNWRRMRVSVVCVIHDGEEMLCDDNSKLKRNARFSCLCNRRWWRNVVWW